MSLALSRCWVLIRSVKTTSGCFVDFLKKKKNLSRNDHAVQRSGRHFTVTTRKQINPNPESSRWYWYLAAIFSSDVLRISLCQTLKIISYVYQEDVCYALSNQRLTNERRQGRGALCFWTTPMSFHTNVIKRRKPGRLVEWYPSGRSQEGVRIIYWQHMWGKRLQGNIRLWEICKLWKSRIQAPPLSKIFMEC